MALKFKKPVSLKGKRLITRHTQFSKYAILRKDPELVFDFEDEYYRTGGADTTFSSAITHSITTNATMVDSDGLIKWAPHNLLTYSEDLTGADWVAGTVFLTNISANRITPNTNLNQHRYDRTTTISASAHTFSVEAKPDGYSFLWLRLGAINGIFNLNTGEVVLSSGGTASSVAVGGGYFRVSISGTAAGNDTARINVLPTASTADFSGDGTSGVLIRNVHLYRSDLGGMVNNPDRNDSYVPTTDSARYLPRRGHHVYNGNAWVNEGLLVESEARTNLLKYTGPLFGSGWSGLASGTAPTNTPGAAVGPDGVSGSASLITHNTAVTGAGTFSVWRYIFSTTTTGTYTFSVWLKAGTITQTRILFNDNAGNRAQTPVTLTSEWQRFDVTGTTISPITAMAVDVGTDGNSTGNPTQSTGTFYVYGAQLELGSTPSSYIPTNGATVTRAAETLTVAAADLPWPSPRIIGPELVTNGTFDTDTSGWAVVSGTGSLSALDGKLIFQADALDAPVAEQQITTEVGKFYLLTADADRNDASQLRIAIGSLSGQVGNYYLKFVSGVDVVQIVFSPSSTSSYISIRNIANDIGDSVILDNISVREISSFGVSIQMDGRVTFADTDTASSTDGGAGESVFYLWKSGATFYAEGVLDTDNGTGMASFVQESIGTRDLVSSTGSYYTPGILVPYNIASRHGSNFVNGAVDGTALTVNTTPTALPDLSATDLNLAYDYMGTIRTFRMWGKDLTDTGIEDATLPSLEPSLSLTFDSTENSFIVEDWAE